MRRKVSFTIILSLFLTVFGLLTAKAQSQFTTKEKVELLQNIDKSLGDIKTIVYKIDYKKKFLSQNDTLHTTAICSLYIAPKDRMRAYNIVDMKEDDNYGYMRYDGKKVFWMDYALDSLSFKVKPEMYDNEYEMEFVVGEYDELLLSEYLRKENPFSVHNTEEVTIKEGVFNNVPVYELFLDIIAPDEECGVLKGFKKHIIRKSDYLPVAFTSVLKCDNMVHYKSAEIEYLGINPDIPLENFKVDKDKAINPAERYKELKEKANIED